MIADLLIGGAVGLVGGVASGLTGTSPGGALVVLSSLLLGAEQHVAQGISLIAQVPPTSLPGIARYRADGARTPWRWLIWMTLGFVAGGLAGSLAAGFVSDGALRWTYVGYLALLLALLVVRPARSVREPAESKVAAAPGAPALLAVGAAAGLSAGLLGIGGGLAVMVGLTALVGVRQHQAQMASLILSLAPVNLPAAWVYFSHGWTASWPVLAGIVAGLSAGGDLGARIANRMSEAQLRRLTFALILAMVVCMAWKAAS